MTFDVKAGTKVTVVDTYWDKDSTQTCCVGNCKNMAYCAMKDSVTGNIFAICESCLRKAMIQKIVMH